MKAKLTKDDIRVVTRHLALVTGESEGSIRRRLKIRAGDQLDLGIGPKPGQSARYYADRLDALMDGEISVYWSIPIKSLIN